MGDFLFEMSQWLYTTPLNGFAQRISESAFSGWILSWFWSIPLMQTIHILAIAGTLVAILLLNLRMHGLIAHAPLQLTVQRYTKVLWIALGFAVATGVGMLFGDTVRNLLNAIFWIKMALLVVGGITALSFSHSLVRQTAGGLDVASAGTKAAGLFLILLWGVIILAGRWIAYAPS